jgi:WD40 repeat protein
LFFPGHKGVVWNLEISNDGSTCYSCGQDRSIRVWERGEDLVFIEEERFLFILFFFYIYDDMLLKKNIYI